MEKDTNVIKELRELNQKVSHLEKILEETKYETRKTTKRVGPVRTFTEAVISLLFGLFIVGPVIVLVITAIMYSFTWIGQKV
ncbi:hypothetical protein P4310_31105 [Bacillus thuringiensis]|uniref:Uncharacterized protein n=1 Tax=Bacillus cereus HuB4-4 TaxID=1053211 RepID=A0A9W5QXS4_BACCE|nr:MULTISPECIES: hypothetical protein [Bacillus cereus group]MED3069836.1 hypothetical protein [Bacillus thuringiensis]EOP92951.1 hypothetical protein IGM_01513 [Bacillus cereus HuB4-4]OUB26320.1 hypothetical protein BK737_25940 [Bacillus thuringiensis serovar palmanyolensis]OUB30744.1 hypothetical protein BK737_17150 [Bacillus thuringiensis serovar palmanyolensis]OUB30765.1 hypothetical protein BK737_16995 [Bacillus thuringiensis serovar palmanyolensis]